MKLLSAVLFASLLAPALSHAEPAVNPGQNDWVAIPEVCDIDSVRLQVVGDNMNIRDFKVMFGDNQVQDLQAELFSAVQRQTSPTAPQAAPNGVIRFPEHSQTPLVDLAGAQRCIKAFRIDGRSDQDNDRAYIVLRGSKKFLLNPNDPSSAIRDDRILGSAAMREHPGMHF